ncbi:hypothetical protein DFH06DRAFT_1143879 [Mycena polygramma]|nr:hypothetical protein DFH06DRAFT_1148141 [Mycena polygramma]KAJ7620774.1 hypothetical protein DFH06DRAFT_1143879 [Mycena polygramma]
MAAIMIIGTTLTPVVETAVTGKGPDLVDPSDCGPYLGLPRTTVAMWSRAAARSFCERRSLLTIEPGVTVFFVRAGTKEICSAGRMGQRLSWKWGQTEQKGEAKGESVQKTRRDRHGLDAHRRGD